MDILTLVLPVCAALAGAALQFSLSRRGESHKQQQERQHAAYVDYLRAITLSAWPRSDEDRHVARLLAAEAKSRIAVYGEKRVVEALAAFERAGPVLDNDASIARFLAMVETMRAGESVAAEALALIMLGPDRGPRFHLSDAKSEDEHHARTPARPKKARAK